jgi:acetyltransferase-like isoleucine patch superfamily enzyme
MLLQLLRGLLASRTFDEHRWPLLEHGVRVKRRHGRIRLGRFARLRKNVHVEVIGTANQPAELLLGEFSCIGTDTTINVASRVEIGNRTFIAWGCDIMDTDFHQINLFNTDQRPISAPVVIGNDVWIGARSMILKGVHIGDHSVVGAGSVVRTRVPPYSLVIGNPARVIPRIHGWSREASATAA